MGKRTGQIAGLAALGALGYLLSKDKKGQSSQSETRPSQSDTRVSAPSPARAAPEMQPITAAEGAGEVFKRPVQASAVPTRVVTPTRIAPIAAPAVSDAYPDESRRGRMTSAPDAIEGPGAAAAVARFKQETEGMSPAIAQGRYPMTTPQPTENTYSRQMGAEAGEAEAYKEATDRFKKETANMSPAVAQGRAPLTKRQPTANTYTRAMGAQAGEAEAYRAAQAAKPAQPARAAAPAASAASKSASAPASAASRPASAASKAAPEKMSSLGTPTRPAPGAPSIYAGKEAWAEYRKRQAEGKRKGGAVKKMASGGVTTSSASKRGDGIAQRGKTRGKIC